MLLIEWCYKNSQTDVFIVTMERWPSSRTKNVHKIFKGNQIFSFYSVYILAMRKLQSSITQSCHCSVRKPSQIIFEVTRVGIVGSVFVKVNTNLRLHGSIPCRAKKRAMTGIFKNWHQLKTHLVCSCCKFLVHCTSLASSLYTVI